MIDKTFRQHEGADKAMYKSCTLVYPPGFGKTNTGCIIASKYQEQQPQLTLGVLVHNAIVKTQWEQTLALYRVSNVKVRTINELISAYDKRSFKIDVLIVDEIHKYFSDVNFTLINGTLIHYQYIIGLTATEPTGTEAKELALIAPIVDTISIGEAIANKWISNHIEINYGLDFNSKDKELYVTLSKPITETNEMFKTLPTLLNSPVFKTPLDVIFACTIGVDHKYLNTSTNMWDTLRIHSDQVCEHVAKLMGWNKELDTNTDRGKQLNYLWSPSAIKERCHNYRKVIKRRNDLINNNITKLNAVLEIITKFNSRKGIIFNQSTEFADILTAAINAKKYNNAICYHSAIESRYLTDSNGRTITTLNGKPKKFGKVTLKRMALEGMQNNVYQHLVTVSALDEGMNITNINLAILTAGTLDTKKQRQRTGRSFRINPYAEDETVLIFNLYMKHFKYLDKDITSRDEVKLQERQKLNTISPIVIDSLEQINYLCEI